MCERACARAFNGLETGFPAQFDFVTAAGWFRVSSLGEKRVCCSFRKRRRVARRSSIDRCRSTVKTRVLACCRAHILYILFFHIRKLDSIIKKYKLAVFMRLCVAAADGLLCLKMIW